MASHNEHFYAEVRWDRLRLENIPAELSPYSRSASGASTARTRARFLQKLRWHIGHSLSCRQKQVIKLVLLGKTQQEIATALGITQQVVSIYKQRAIKHLREKINH